MPDPVAHGAPGLFDPLTLAKITNLQLRARMVVEGYLTGLHRAHHKGSNVEFAEYLEYLPGDDPKHVDWKVYARSERYLIKQFEEETSLRTYLLIDGSASMGYGRGAMTKLTYAVTAAAALAYLLLHQRDAVGLATFDAGVRSFVPARAQLSHLPVLAEAMVAMRPTGRTNLRAAVDMLATEVKRRSLVIVLSDFLDESDDAIRALASLRRRHHEVLAIQILDHDELTFPFDHLTRFESLEDDRFAQADPLAIRDEYLRELARFLDRVRAGFAAERMDYVRFDTLDPLDRVLTAYLARRERRS
ncbi:MAG: DUF58 domain-containing protein [Myxococcales bacterium]|nr:DUF58 domain-containing protein [Myxococcales bacterium]